MPLYIVSGKFYIIPAFLIPIRWQDINNRYLNIEGLYELLSISVRDMLTTLDTRQDNLIAYRSLRKQVGLLLEVIDEEKTEARSAVTKSIV